MGSFSSVPKIENEDHQDKDILVPPNLTREELLGYCRSQIPDGTPGLLKRTFLYLRNDPNCYINRRSSFIALGVNSDKFIRCPEGALEWGRRRFFILQELISYSPDIMCLQEVDHYDFLKRTLESQGYIGVFYPKPDSPCIYIKDNNGPDGCAIFYRADRFTQIAQHSKILEVWKIGSNQVAIMLVLKDTMTGNELCVATTHLKARRGALLASLRNEQGKDMLEFIKTNYGERPLVICGDFNAEPSEMVYRTVLNNKALNLSSAYFHNNREPDYTTWKIREEGECCHAIDYIFYSKDKLAVNCVLKFPTGEEIGVDRVPSMSYPSDHFSLVCDFSFNNN